MIRLAVISGKGGTGKTMVTAALAKLMKGSRVLADCDVDAANLDLLMNSRPLGTRAFMGMNVAMIDPALCLRCGECEAHCRFGAVGREGEDYLVNSFRCEGCAVCTVVCPASAVSMQPRQTGEIRYSETAAGHLVHAWLVPGAGNSGLLVHAVKKMALERDGPCDLFLIDGPPGTGCPLISTISGVDAVLVVAEPSISGVHDLGRVIAVCRQFRPRIFVAVNRSDLDPARTGEIGAYCTKEQIPLIGTIPFDPAVIAAVRAGIPLPDAGPSPAAQAISDLATRLEQELVHCGTGH